MSTNKNALIRYQALDRCFRNHVRRYYIEDLIDACNRALQVYTSSPTEVHERQVWKDIVDMERIYPGARIDRVKEGRRKYYRYRDPSYSISSSPLTESEAYMLRDTIQLLSRFDGMPQFAEISELIARLESSFGLKEHRHEVVSFQHNPYLRGLEHLSTLINNIIYRQTISIRYKRFGEDYSTSFLIHPYYLKQHNGRWYLFGLRTSTGRRSRIISLALDRMQAISSGSVPYIPNDTIDWEEYFDDIVGISRPDTPIDTVQLEVRSNVFPYIETNPLHGSQRIIDRGSEWCRIELRLKINHELENLLLSYIDSIRILAPKSLRCRMKERLEEAMRLQRREEEC